MPNNKIIDLDRLSRFKDKLDIELDKKANVDGNYPTMTVGNADSLTPYGENSGANDTTPFVFQSTGGSSDVGVKAYLRALRGNSVAWNQLCSNNLATTTFAGVTFTNNGDGTFTLNGTASSLITIILNGTNKPTIISGHKYLLKVGGISSFSADDVSLVYNSNGFKTNTSMILEGVSSNYVSGKINAGTNSSYPTLRIANGVQLTNVKISQQLFDLTLMFGAGNEPTSVLEFNRLFPEPYYPYNAGTLLSCKVNGIKNVGYNAFDYSQIENGYINPSTGNSDTDSSFKHSGYIRIIAGQTYTCEVDRANKTWTYVYQYDKNKTFIKETDVNNGNSITIENNAQYVRLGWQSVTNNENSCFHLTWDGSRTGYETYNSETYTLPNVELRSAGDVYDVLYSTGGGKRRIGVVDLGTLTWSASGLSTETNHIWYVNNFDGKVRTPNLLSIKYVYVKESLLSTTPNTVCVLGDNSLRVNTGSSSSTPTGLLFYELATETDITTEENPGWQNPQDIDDFGTQEFLYDSDIDIPVPQGNEFFYPVDYKAFIDSLGGREDIEYDASQVVSQEQLVSSETQRDTIDNILLETICGTLRQLLASSQSIDFLNTKVVDLGTLTWTRITSTQTPLFQANIPDLKGVSGTNVVINAISTKYKSDTQNNVFYSSSANMNMCAFTNHYIYIADNSYSDATAFKNAMKGVLLAYEKA